MVTKRARLWVRRGATLAVSAVVIALAAAIWLLSSLIGESLLAVEAPEPDFDIVVGLRTARTIRLPLTDETARDGTWGLDFRGGWARVGPVLDVSNDTVLRRLESVNGTIRRSTVADFVPHIGSDPADSGIQFTEVLLESTLGTFSAWEVAGADDTWIVVIHGHSEGRRQTLSALPALAGAGFPVLVPTYRNHEAAPQTESGRFSLGVGERREIEAALEYAFLSGARDVVLYAYGTGSTVVGDVLHESPWADLVVGVVLDSPVLDPGAAVDFDASERNVPGFVIGWAKALATLRFGIDWSAVDQVQRAAEWMTPVLVVHGDADSVAPIRSSRDFAEALPGLVTLVEVEGGVHGAVWNADPARYEAAVLQFLGGVAEGPSDLDPIDPEEIARRAERS
jgi:hypothetical protein